MWCTDTIDVNGKETTFPYPDTVGPCVYTNSSGLRYQAIEVRRCLEAGLLESPLLTHADSKHIASIEDELRRQVGCQYPQDE